MLRFGMSSHCEIPRPRAQPLRITHVCCHVSPPRRRNEVQLPAQGRQTHRRKSRRLGVKPLTYADQRRLRSPRML
eukprot:5280784-Prymnesium_polylepis.2